MTEAGEEPRDTEQAARRSDPVEWLYLAASPIFATMAVFTAVAGGPADPLCAQGYGWSLSGMVPMYLLMSVFHSRPWLNLAGRRWTKVPSDIPSKKRQPYE